MESFENFFTLFTKFEYSSLLNIFDITFILIASISIFYALRKGLINSFLNLIKWILIVFAIKFGAPIIHPIFLNFNFIGEYTSSVLVFLSTLIVSYILISFINRILIGVIQPKRSFFIDIFLGGSFGLLRGYIIAVLLFGLTNSISPINIKNFKSIDNAIFIELVEMGINFIGEVPKGFEKITDDLESAI